MGRKKLSILVVTFALWAALPVAGDVLTVVADRDNTLYEAVSPKNGISNGAGEHFFVGRTAGESEEAPEGLLSLRRGLIHFDLSSIPPGSTIDSVVLSLNMSKTIAAATPVSLHRATSDWGEGTSDAPGQEGGGAPATADDATWFHTFFDTDFWTTEGGDFVSVPSATTMVDQAGPYSWGSTSGMEADVSAWVDDPGSNFGWVVVGEEGPSGETGGPTAKRFDTREVITEGPLLPQLQVDFTVPVPVELQSIDID